MHRTAPQPAPLVWCAVLTADQRRAGEGHDAPHQQQTRKPLAQDQTGQDGDEDRPDVDQQRGDAGIERVLGGVQRDVVDGEPQDPAEDDSAPRPPRRQRLAPDQHQQPQGEAADQEPAERERAGLKAAPGVADPDERRGPQDHRHPGGDHDRAMLGRVSARAGRDSSHH